MPVFRACLLADFGKIVHLAANCRVDIAQALPLQGYCTLRAFAESKFADAGNQQRETVEFVPFTVLNPTHQSLGSLGQDTMAEETKKETAEVKKSSVSKEEVTQIILRPYPKIVFLWPTFLVGLAVAMWLSFAVDDTLDATNARHYMPSLIFLVVFALNLVVISFDFPRTTSLTLFFLAAAVVCGGLLMFTYKPDWVAPLKSFFELLRPTASALFYWLITIMLGIIYIIVMIAVRFDYWEVRPNELLHHHGVLSNLERFSAPNLRIEKEINDVFEYLLLRSGRLILSPRDVQRPIVLDNVLFISKKEQAITKMLSALQVQVRTD